LERIPPQLEAPSEAPEAAQTPADEAPRTQASPETEHVPWWRRIFG
jgi:hypothetical protein